MRLLLVGDAGAVAERYAWNKQQVTEFSVKSMYRFMGVSRSADSAWLERRPQIAIEKDDAELVEVIKTLFQKSRKNYGTRRLKKALVGLGRPVSRHRIGRLMGAAGLACKTQRTLKTERVHHPRYQTRAEAKQELFEYIEVFYNRERLLTPITIGRHWTTKCRLNRLNFVSGKVLIHHAEQSTDSPATATKPETWR